jgi:cysteine-rich repeat protein
MRRKTHTVALALATSAAVAAPLLSASSCSSTSSSGPSDAGPDSTPLVAGVCGDGVLNLGEQCDPGPDGGPGCDKDCNFFCIPDTINGNALCDDHNPCNGIEACAGDDNDAGVPAHTCAKGTPEPDGTPCGSGSMCHAGVCAGAAVCGNGIVEGSEECDLGSENGTGAGCDGDCRWTCVADDPTRDCAATGGCATQGTCNEATHVCTAGTPVADGTPCGTNQVCRSGSCISVTCGDGVVEAPEQCDFGQANGIGTGCEANCTFSCTLSPNDCVTPDPCQGTNTCTAVTVTGSPGQKCLVGTPPNGGSCGNGGTCQSDHLCVSPNCGNAALDPGEQCDWGSMNVHGSGCEPDCTFSCSSSPLSSNACPGLDPCSAAPEACQTVAGPGSNGGQKCAPATVLAACASCGGASVCVNHTCKPHACGDGCLVAPETCDPPDDNKTCDSTCQRIVCGDGKRTGNEQCDDGNTTNLDGCDSNCNFEQLQRATLFEYMSTTDSFCTNNALSVQPGGALTTAGLAVVQSQNANDVATGITNVIFKFTGPGATPADLSGTTGPVVLGSLAGAPEDADGGTAYNGSSDTDWWYALDLTMVDATRTALTSLTGSYSGKTLSAGPGRITIRVDISGSPARLDLWSAKLNIAVGPTSAPAIATGGVPPGHLSSENLEPGLTSFESEGVGGSGPTGELCGNITAASLAGVVIPSAIATGGVQACTEGYGPTTSMLDVLVGGCTVTGMGVITATQPDQQDPSVTFPAGTKAPYVLSASTGSHVVDTCKDGSASPQTVPVATCEAGKAYSAAFLFQTDRVIVR